MRSSGGRTKRIRLLRREINTLKQKMNQQQNSARVNGDDEKEEGGGGGGGGNGPSHAGTGTRFSQLVDDLVIPGPDSSLSLNQTLLLYWN